MSEKIKRLKRELKYKGAIVDFYQDTMEIDALIRPHGILSVIKGLQRLFL